MSINGHEVGRLNGEEKANGHALNGHATNAHTPTNGAAHAEDAHAASNGDGHGDGNGHVNGNGNGHVNGPQADEASLRPQAPREDTSHKALMAALGDDSRASALFSKVCFLARARYGILPQDAEDIFHEAVVTYLAVHERYPPGDNHFGILVGIFHKKSLEFLDGQDRQGRVARRFVARLQADRPDVARGEDPSGPAVERVVREEDAQLIRSAISSLSDEARELLLTLAEGRMTRLELIETLGINRNTFDTRLRGVRLRLKRTLAESGVI